VPRVWDAANGNARGVLSGHEKKVLDVHFAPASAWLVTASGDGTARVWDVATLQSRFVLRGHNGVVRTVRVSPNGKWIVTAGNDSTARVWDATAGQLLSIFARQSQHSTERAFFARRAMVLTETRQQRAFVCRCSRQIDCIGAFARK
jgi:WD40 repeat protein